MLRPYLPELSSIGKTDNAETKNRIARRMDRCPQAAARQGEGIHSPARRAERRAARAADGGAREGVRVRRPRWAPHAARSVWEEAPAHGLSLHVRSASRLGG